MRDSLLPLDILLHTPLYKRIEVDDAAVLELRDFEGPIDCYCPECGNYSVYQREDMTPSRRRARVPALAVSYSPPTSVEEDAPLYFEMVFQCSRDTNHKLVFYFRKFKGILVKVGEYPSLADRKFPEVTKYKKELGRYFFDYKQAIYLFSHGVGIGSFAYLRRVFERVIDETAIAKYQGKKDWSLDAWKSGKRMNERIKELAAELPQFLVENAFLYSILSKGIHELDEQECLDTFEIVRSAIDEILAERLSEKEKEERRKKVERQLAKIQSRLVREKK